MKKILQQPVLCVLFYFKLCAVTYTSCWAPISGVCVADISCSGQCTVSLHKAAVWTILVPPNSHLPGSLLRSGFCFVVPRKVNQRSPLLLPRHTKNSIISALQFLALLFYTLLHFAFQCLLRSPVHPDSSLRAGELPATVAEHAQSVPHQGHLLFLLCHGALH